jgi:hypothetical protein
MLGGPLTVSLLKLTFRPKRETIRPSAHSVGVRQPEHLEHYLNSMQPVAFGRGPPDIVARTVRNRAVSLLI